MAVVVINPQSFIGSDILYLIFEEDRVFKNLHPDWLDLRGNMRHDEAVILD